VKKVLIITYYWPPSGGAGVQRWLKLTRYLPELGWLPIVITVHPEDASYPLYDESFDKEVHESVKVIRTRSRELFGIYRKISGSKKIPYGGFANEQEDNFIQKVARFIRGNFVLPDSRKGWNRFAFRSAVELIRKEEGIECIITSSPPHSTQLTGLKLRKKFGITWIADLRDPWTDIYYYRQLYPTFPAHKLNLHYEHKVMRSADKILTVGPFLKDLFTAKHRLDPDKVEILYNGFDPSDFQNLPEPKKNFFRISYIGTLSDVYPVESFTRVILDLLKEIPAIRLRFIGAVSSSQRRKLSQIPSENIEYIGHVSHHEAIRQMAQSSLLLLIIPEHETSRGILTGKIFEYMASGRPVVGIGPVDGDAARILEESNAGRMVDFKDEKGLKATLLDYFRKFNDNNLPATRPPLRYSRENLAGRLVQVMSDLVKY